MSWSIVFIRLANFGFGTISSIYRTFQFTHVYIFNSNAFERVPMKVPYVNSPQSKCNSLDLPNSRAANHINFHIASRASQSRNKLKSPRNSFVPNYVSQLLFENFPMRHDFETLKHYLLCHVRLLNIHLPKMFI